MKKLGLLREDINDVVVLLVLVVARQMMQNLIVLSFCQQERLLRVIIIFIDCKQHKRGGCSALYTKV